MEVAIFAEKFGFGAIVNFTRLVNDILSKIFPPTYSKFMLVWVKMWFKGVMACLDMIMEWYMPKN